MINRVTLDDFRAIRRVDLALGRLNFIVGANGSGKTSVLQGVHCLAQLAPGGKTPQELFQYARAPSNLCQRGAESFRLMLEATRGDHHVQGFKVIVKASDEVSANLDLIADGVRATSDLPNDHSFGRLLPEAVQSLRSVVLLRLDAGSLADPSPVGSVRIEFNGQGLATVLGRMKLADDARFEQIVSAVRSVIPQITRLKVDQIDIMKTESELATIGSEPQQLRIRRVVPHYALSFDTQSAKGLPASAMSEGTLLTLGLFTALVGPEAPRLVLIDDFDRGLHPVAQKTLLAQVRKLLEANPELQILATSHSPYLLDNLTYEEVFISALLADGTAACARLTDHPDAKRWREEMWPGEFWSSMGERWVEAVEARRRLTNSGA